MEKITSITSDINYYTYNYICRCSERLDPETHRHMQNTAEYAGIIAEDFARRFPETNLNDTAVQRIKLAAAIHDIGKLTVPRDILNKCDKLELDEIHIIQEHPVAGSMILSWLLSDPEDEFSRCCRDVCRYHHERWDGSGYPDGLEGNAIPIEAQIVAIADVLDALTEDRHYRKAMNFNEAYSIICRGGCGTFSEKIYESFLSCRKNIERKSGKSR